MNQLAIVPNQSLVAQIERNAILGGLPKRAFLEPIAPTKREAIEVYPFVLSNHAQLAKGFVQQMEIKTLYGPFAEIEFAMIQHADPRIVVPLFCTGERLKELYSALVVNLQNWHPHLHNFAEFSEEMNYQLTEICKEIAPFVQSQYLEWFWKKMTVIINQPLTWYGGNRQVQTRASVAMQQAINRANGRKMSQDLIEMKQRVDSGEIHYTAYENELNALYFGG